MKRATRGRDSRFWRLVGALAVWLTLALGAGACGGDDDETPAKRE
jgi:hypothetical protein